MKGVDTTTMPRDNASLLRKNEQQVTESRVLTERQASIEYDSIFHLLIYIFSLLFQVLREIINLLPGATTAVQQVTVDFEKGLWSALRTVLPDVQIRGCVFHWTQAIWRKVNNKNM